MNVEVLNVGSLAPKFELVSDSGDIVSLDSLLDKNLVIYFYPKDDTPGCKKEALDFVELASEYDAVDTRVIGISKDSVNSHSVFKEKYGITLTLLSDAENIVSSLYGVYVEKSMFGKKYKGVERSTFLIDKKGVLCKMWRNVKVKGHALEVLEMCKAILYDS